MRQVTELQAQVSLEEAGQQGSKREQQGSETALLKH